MVTSTRQVDLGSIIVSGTTAIRGTPSLVASGGGTTTADGADLGTLLGTWGATPKR